MSRSRSVDSSMSDCNCAASSSRTDFLTLPSTSALSHPSPSDPLRRVGDRTGIISDSQPLYSSAASGVYKRQVLVHSMTSLPTSNPDGNAQKCTPQQLSLIHISEPTRLRRSSDAVFCLKKQKTQTLDRGTRKGSLTSRTPLG